MHVATRTNWAHHTCRGVCTLYHTDYYYETYPAPGTQVYTIYGENQNAATAAFIYAGAFDQARELAAAFTPSWLAGSQLRAARSDYLEGLSHGFLHRCEKIAKEQLAHVAKQKDARRLAEEKKEVLLEKAEKLRIARLREQEELRLAQEQQARDETPEGLAVIAAAKAAADTAAAEKLAAAERKAKEVAARVPGSELVGARIKKRFPVQGGGSRLYPGRIASVYLEEGWRTRACSSTTATATRSEWRRRGRSS